MAYAHLPPDELRRRLAGGEDVYVLDVRESEELAEWSFPGAAHIPLGQLGQHLDQLPRDRQIVVLCRSGHRSSQAAAALDRHGWDAANLEGGVIAWLESEPGA